MGPHSGGTPKMIGSCDADQGPPEVATLGRGLDVVVMYVRHGDEGGFGHP